MYADLHSFTPSLLHSFTPSLLHSSFFFLLLAVVFARCRQMSTWTSRVQWAMPDLTREFQSGLGNAGPQPASFGADWATPDLNRGAPERTGQRRTSPGDLPSGVGGAGPQLPEDMSEDMSKESKRYVRRYVRNMSDKNVRRYVRRYVNRNVR